MAGLARRAAGQWVPIARRKYSSENWESHTAFRRINNRWVRGVTGINLYSDPSFTDQTLNTARSHAGWVVGGGQAVGEAYSDFYFNDTNSASPLPLTQGVEYKFTFTATTQSTDGTNIGIYQSSDWSELAWLNCPSGQSLTHSLTIVWPAENMHLELWISSPVALSQISITEVESLHSPLVDKGALIFEDNFYGESLDTSKWTNLRGTDPYTYGSPYNPDLEDTYFVRDQVRVQGGKLQLVCEPQLVQDPLGGAWYNHVGGVVHSGAHFSFTYGYAETRMKVPDTLDTWPAFWMASTPVDQDWPPEIDIAEFLPDGGEHVSPWFNVHWDDNGHAFSNNPYTDGSQSLGGEWHTFGMLWEPGKLTAYLDGVPGPVYQGIGVPNRAMYLIFGMGVTRGAMLSEPLTFEVDYIRVWNLSV